MTQSVSLYPYSFLPWPKTNPLQIPLSFSRAHGNPSRKVKIFLSNFNSATSCGPRVKSPWRGRSNGKFELVTVREPGAEIANREKKNTFFFCFNCWQQCWIRTVGSGSRRSISHSQWEMFSTGCAQQYGAILRDLDWGRSRSRWEGHNSDFPSNGCLWGHESVSFGFVGCSYLDKACFPDQWEITRKTFWFSMQVIIAPLR